MGMVEAAERLMALVDSDFDGRGLCCLAEAMDTLAAVLHGNHAGPLANCAERRCHEAKAVARIFYPVSPRDG